MANHNPLSTIAEELASSIADEFPTFEDYKVRVDAGEAGMIYVALREAKAKLDLGEELSTALEAHLDRELGDRARDIQFAISLGSGNRDLLLQIELRQS
ncbi:MAG: hypothetical protein ACNA8W_10255 [Bradymonadaceae bacterium]